MDWAASFFMKGRTGVRAPWSPKAARHHHLYSKSCSWGIGPHRREAPGAPGQAWEPQKRGGQPLREAMSPCPEPPTVCRPYRAPSFCPWRKQDHRDGGSHRAFHKLLVAATWACMEQPLRHIAAAKGLQRLGNWSPEGCDSPRLTQLKPSEYLDQGNPCSAASLLHKLDGRNSPVPQFSCL